MTVKSIKDLHLEVTKLDSAILAKIGTEIGRRPGVGDLTAKFDTHIKGVCDIHGRGSHIKGDGPNHLKSEVRDFTDIERVITNYSGLVDRLALDVAAKIKSGGGIR